MEPAPPPPADSADGVTAEQLGASAWELVAFKTAVLQYILRDEVDERTAVGVVWNGGDWRPMVAQYASLAWDVAVRLTRRAAAGAELRPFPDPYGPD
jgi:hypothetical protein